MKKKLAIILALILLLPIFAIGFLGLQVAQNDSQLIARQHRKMVSGELQSALSLVESAMTHRTRQFEQLCALQSTSPEALLQKADEAPFVRQYFVINSRGQLKYPVPNKFNTEAEKKFLESTAHLWTHRFPFKSSSEKAPANGGSGYHPFYWNRGLQFIFWTGTPDGKRIGFEVEKMMLISEIIGTLPQTPVAQSDDKQIRLVSENGKTMYQYGGYVPPENAQPVAEVALPVPLGSWRLQYFAPPLATDSGLTTRTVIILLVIGTLLLMVLALGAYFIHQYNRESRLAAQQVNFVNQVSHELKTPLTNIRMYSELLAEQLDEEDDTQQRYISHITTESQRLSRLIENVLSFARNNRNKLVLHPSQGCVDEVIAETLAGFRPSLTRLSIAVETSLDARETVIFDKDVVRQVLTNLISNVEKYAHEGKWIKIESKFSQTDVHVTVTDNGPGISPRQRETIFKPFARLDNKVTQRAAGTGIGLGIARTLAKLHGGDLTVKNCEAGAAFEFKFSVQRKLS